MPYHFLPSLHPSFLSPTWPSSLKAGNGVFVFILGEEGSYLAPIWHSMEFPFILQTIYAEFRNLGAIEMGGIICISNLKRKKKKCPLPSARDQWEPLTLVFKDHSTWRLGELTKQPQCLGPHCHPLTLPYSNPTSYGSWFIIFKRSPGDLKGWAAERHQNL